MKRFERNPKDKDKKQTNDENMEERQITRSFQPPPFNLFTTAFDNEHFLPQFSNDDENEIFDSEEDFLSMENRDFSFDIGEDFFSTQNNENFFSNQNNERSQNNDFSLNSASNTTYNQNYTEQTSDEFPMQEFVQQIQQAHYTAHNGAVYSHFNGRAYYVMPDSTLGFPVNQFQQPEEQEDDFNIDDYLMFDDNISEKTEKKPESKTDKMDVPTDKKVEDTQVKDKVEDSKMKVEDTKPNDKVDTKTDKVDTKTDKTEEEKIKLDDDTKDTVGLDYYMDVQVQELKKTEDYDLENSSASEDELDEKELKNRKISQKEYKKARRETKAKDIEAIAKTALPVTDDEKKEIDDLQESRKKDYKDRNDKRGKYSEDTIKKLMNRGEQMKEVSLYHNPYLRRAYRNAISKDKREKGGSKLYDDNQGKIRDKLLDVLKKDHKKMKWTRGDFSSDKVWEIVEWMLSNRISNTKTGSRLNENIGKGGLKGSPLMAFHHVSWKEAGNKRFEKYALHGPNLVARHDERELSEKKKKTKKKSDIRTPGHHEYDHQTNGFKVEDKWGGKRNPGKGQFVAMDPEAVFYTSKPLLEKRLSKKDRYVNKRKREEDEDLKDAKKKRPDPLPLSNSDVKTVLDLIGPKSSENSNLSDQNSMKVDDQKKNTSLSEEKEKNTFSFEDKKSEKQDVLNTDFIVDENGLLIDDFNTTGHYDLENEFQRLMARWDRTNKMRGERDFYVNPSILENDNIGIGSMEQYEHECGQMSAFNAIIMNILGDTSMEAVLSDPILLNQFMEFSNDRQFLNTLGDFENDIDEDQVLDILQSQGATDVAVVSDFTALQTILNLANDGNENELIEVLGEKIYEKFRPGLDALMDFKTGRRPNITLVVNTTAGDLNSMGYHWIAVRVERHIGGLKAYYMDSVPDLGPYNLLLQGLKNVLR